MLKQTSNGINWIVDGLTVTPTEYWDDVATSGALNRTKALS